MTIALPAHAFTAVRMKEKGNRADQRGSNAAMVKYKKIFLSFYSPKLFVVSIVNYKKNAKV